MTLLHEGLLLYLMIAVYYGYILFSEEVYETIKSRHDGIEKDLLSVTYAFGAIIICLVWPLFFIIDMFGEE